MFERRIDNSPKTLETLLTEIENISGKIPPENYPLFVDTLKRIFAEGNKPLYDGLANFGKAKLILQNRIELLYSYIYLDVPYRVIRDQANKIIVADWQKAQTKSFFAKHPKLMQLVEKVGNRKYKESKIINLILGIYYSLGFDNNLSQIFNQGADDLISSSEFGFTSNELSQEVDPNRLELGGKLRVAIEIETGVPFSKNSEKIVDAILGMFLESAKLNKNRNELKINLFILLAWVGDAFLYACLARKQLKANLNGETNFFNHINTPFSNDNLRKIFQQLSISFQIPEERNDFGGRADQRDKYEASFIEFVFGLYFIVSESTEDIEERLDKYVTEKILKPEN